MKNAANILNDIEEALSNMEHATYSRKKEILCALLHLYIDKSKENLLLSYKDLNEIIDLSKSKMASENINVTIDSNEIEFDKSRFMMIIEATIGILNKNDALNKEVRFNKK